MEKKFEAILFDLDGTLFDTKSSILNSLMATIKTLKLKELTKDEISTFIGPPVATSIKRYYPELPEEKIDKIIKVYRKYYMEVEILNAELFPGMLKVIQTLKANDYKLGLATYKLKECVMKLFDYKDVTKYFDAIGASLAEKGFTKTDIIKFVLNDLKITNIDNICFIGDTEHDLRGAINLNLPFIGVSYGAGFKGLTEEEKNYNKFISMCDKPEDILKYV